MHVQTSHAYTPPVTPVTRPAADDTQKATPTANAPATTAPPTNNTVTGTTGGRLSKEVIDQLMAETQETGVSNTLPSAYQHQIEDIASDPQFAADQAKKWGTFPVLVLYKIPPGVPQHSGPGAASPAENAAFLKYVVQPSMEGSRQRAVDAVQDNLKAAYESNLAQGKSGAETYLNMLEIQVSQPQEYWDAIDPDSSAPKEIAQGKLDLLRHLMAQNKSNLSDATG